MANGATLTLVSGFGLGRWVSADPKAFYGVTSPEIGKTKGTIQVYEDRSFADSFVDDDIPGSLAVKRNQNYLKLRKSRF